MDKANGQFVSYACTVDANLQMVSINDSYPALIPGNDNIMGEVYNVPKMGILYYLDQLEGYPNYYNRGLVKVQLESGEITNAIVYLFKDVNSPYIHTESEYIEHKDGVFYWKGSKYERSEDNYYD